MIASSAPFHDWTAHPIAELTAAPYTTCSPNLVALANYIGPLYMLQPLGCHGVRPVRGGTRPSAHCAGAAADLRYMPAKPDPARRELIETKLLPFLINRQQLLGVQAIHDYYACRIWRAGRGWKPATPDQYGMGQTWAGWLHIETHPNQWTNATRIINRLDTTSPPFDPEHGKYGTYPTDGKPTIRQGARGDLVAYAQAVIGAGIDGAFGPQTDTIVRTWQTAHHLTADGIIGPRTWLAIDTAAKGVHP